MHPDAGFRNPPRLDAEISRPQPLGPKTAQQVAEGWQRRIRRAQATQFAVPLLGLPAIAVPTGMTSARPGVSAAELPMGVQLIGPRFREDLLLDAAAVIESRCPPMTPLDPRW